MSATTRPGMRVAFLSVSAEMGGSEVSLLELMRGLRAAKPDWRLDVIVPREGPLAARARTWGVAVHVLPMPARFARLGESGGSGGAGSAVARGAALLRAAGGMRTYRRHLRRLLHDLAPDVVHTNGFKLHVLGRFAVPDRSALVWHVHEYVSGRPISRALLRRTAARSAVVVANSRSVAADVSTVLADRVPVRTVYNAVDLEEFNPSGDRADLDAASGLPPAPAGTVRVGLIATYGRWKGHEPFLRAMQMLAPSTEIRGYVIGGPLYDTAGSQYSRAELEAVADSAGLTGRVGFTGFVERPASVMRALDIVVHASTLPEPFGLVIAEGMACGRAVVASDGGGAAELVRDGVDALTHRSGSAADLARCIATLAADPDLRRRLGSAARASAERRFQPQALAEAFTAIYEDACEGMRTHV